MYWCFVLGFSTGLLVTHLLVTVLLEESSPSNLNDRLNESKESKPQQPNQFSSFVISYNIILTSPGDLLKPLRQTWTNNLNHVHYYISLEGEVTHPPSPFVKAIDSNLGYPLLATLKLICDRERSIDFKWYGMLSESTYLKVNEFETLIKRINIIRPFTIGSVEFSQREGRPLETYCSEMALFMNHLMINKICPELKYCRKTVETNSEASELSNCIHNITGEPMCTHNKLQDIFYHWHGKLSYDDFQYGSHDDGRSNKRFINSLVFYPLTTADHFKHFHYHTLKLDLIRYTKEYKDILKHYNNIKLSKHFIKPLPLLPELTGIINITNIQNEGYSLKITSSEIPIRHIAYDFHKGILELTSSKDIHIYTQKSFLPWSIHSIRQISYKTNKVNYVIGVSPFSQTFQRFMWTFETTFLSRSNLAGNKTATILIIIFTKSKVSTINKKGLYSVTTLTEMYKKKYPFKDIRLITTDREPSWYNLLTIASQTYHPYQLVFIVTTRLDFSAQILNTCTSNTIEGSQVYFPMMFSPYDPISYHKKRLLFPYATKLLIQNGNWLPPSDNIACLYVSDLITVLKTVGSITGGISLLDSINNNDRLGLKVFTAPDLGLVNIWREASCSHGDGPASVFCDVFIKSPLCQCV